MPETKASVTAPSLLPLPDPDPRHGALIALHLIEHGPEGVECTRCGAQENQPCAGLDRGHHHERGWRLKNFLVATLRHHLELPTPGTPGDFELPPTQPQAVALLEEASRR